MRVNIKERGHIIGIDVLLESTRHRTYVGRLGRSSEKGDYTFTYIDEYLYGEDSLPLGPELLLTKRVHSSKELFPSFSDRLPSPQNPAYPEYLKEFGLTVEEQDPFVLLATVGRSGPSSFVFEPVFADDLSRDDIAHFRKELGLTMRDFSIAFDISIASVLRIEKGQNSGRDVLKKLEIYKRFPEVALFEVRRNSAKLHTGIKEKIIRKLKEKMASTLIHQIDAWETESFKRFQVICEEGFQGIHQSPFKKGFWHCAFVLSDGRPDMPLKEFREILRHSKTGKTGWDVFLVPDSIDTAAYPFQGGVEVCLAEKTAFREDPGHSDFWRAEPSGRFSLLRGHQEDGLEYQANNAFDFVIILWRIAEILLYIENVTKKLGISKTSSIIRMTWTGLKGRKISTKNTEVMLSPDNNYICRQDKVFVTHVVPETDAIKSSLVQDTHKISGPLFEAFNFFSLSPDVIKNHLRTLLQSDVRW